LTGSDTAVNNNPTWGGGGEYSVFCQQPQRKSRTQYAVKFHPLSKNEWLQISLISLGVFPVSICGQKEVGFFLKMFIALKFVVQRYTWMQE